MTISKNILTQIQVTIPKDILDILEAKSSNNNRSLSNYIVTLIINDLQKWSPILIKWFNKELSDRDHISDTHVYRILKEAANNVGK